MTSSAFVTVDGGVECKRLLEQNHVRIPQRLGLLPYTEQLQKESDRRILHLLNGLNASVLVGEPMPAIYNYLGSICRYLDQFNQRLTQETLVRLVKLVYLIFTKEGQWFEVVHHAAKTLEKLIPKSRLTRKELSLDWEPVFKLYYGAVYGKLENIDNDKIKSATKLLKRFYPLEATKEIWEQLQVHISPRNSMDKFCNLCIRFLPTEMTGEEHRSHGAALWFDTLWELYRVVEMNGKWGEEIPSIFASLVQYAPDFIDWTPYYDDLFIRILRGLGLVLREGKVAVSDGSTMSSVEAFASFVADTLSGPHSCFVHLERVIRCVKSYLHPQNNGTHTVVIILFLQCITDRIITRFRLERIKKHKRKVPVEYYLTDEDINKFVDLLLPSAFFALYNNIGVKLAAKLIAQLGALAPQKTIPLLLKETYPAMTAVSEPERLTQTLECLVELIYLIASDKGKPDSPPKNLGKIIEQHDPKDERDLLWKSKAIYCWKQKKNVHTPIDLHDLSYRRHLIYIAEILCEAIDVNDVVKTALSLQNLHLIFSLMPVIDSSPCSKLHKDLTEDEQVLVFITSRLPKLAYSILEKIIKSIECLSVCAPRSSCGVLGGLKDKDTAEGGDEALLKKMMDRCVGVLIENSCTEVTQKLIDMIYATVTSSQYESLTATELLTSVMGQCIYVHPHSWIRFAKFIHKKLKHELPESVRKQKDLESTPLWYVHLAAALFYTSSQCLVENMSLCFDILDLLLDCENLYAYEAGSTALSMTLYVLSRVYPEHHTQNRKHNDQSLKKWVPVRDWARVYYDYEIKMRWHVPDEARKKMVQKCVDRFLAPNMKKLLDTKTDHHALRKASMIVLSAVSGASTSFPQPTAQRPDGQLASVLPYHTLKPRHVEHNNWDIRLPDGRNTAESVVEMCESVIARLVEDKREHSKTITSLIYTQAILVDPATPDASTIGEYASLLGEYYGFLIDPLSNGKRVSMLGIEGIMGALNVTMSVLTDVEHFSTFHLRVMKTFARLSINENSEIRTLAQSKLSHLLGMYPQAREHLIDIVLAPLADAKATRDQLKGALTVLVSNRWYLPGNYVTREKVWKAIITAREVDFPEVLALFDSIRSKISKMSKYTREDKESQALNDAAQKWYNELEKPAEWKKLASAESLKPLKKELEERKEQRKKDHLAVVSMLHQELARVGLHHKKMKLARLMLWKCQKESCDVATIKILLHRLVDDVEYLRDRSADELSYWLKKNKPKTSRMSYTCPTRDKACPKLACGLRSDNLFLCYDSANLPSTEAKWNKVVFSSKLYGCYKWPKTIDVMTYASNALLQRGALSECEKEIVAAFEKKAYLKKWLGFLLVEKNEEESMNENTYYMIKYLLRNFPDNPLILQNLKSYWDSLMPKKDRASQRLAAEIFAGIAKGTKYRKFKELEVLWKSMSVKVDHFYDYINEDAEANWRLCIAAVLSDDNRRYFWLVEQLLVGMQRTGRTAFHHAARSDLIPASTWRETQTRKRISEIAWRHLPNAINELRRVAVSTTLKHICTTIDANLNSQYEGVPRRFHLPGIDHWLKLFREQIGTAVSGTSSSSLRSAQSQNSMIASMADAVSNVTKKLLGDNERTNQRKRLQSLIYLRTMLDFLVQYYEECMTCLTPGIIDVWPTLIELANEDEAVETTETKADSDIRSDAATIIHEYMSNLLLTESFADQFIDVISETFTRTQIWRARVSMLKFVQVLIFSNIFVGEKKDRCKKIVNLIFTAIADSQNEIRQEASKCMLTLVHCNYIKPNAELVSSIDDLMRKEKRQSKHGAVLAYGAVVMAHPYSTPPILVPVLRNLTRVGKKQTELAQAAASALSQFRRSHKDEWDSVVKRTLGEELFYEIENATAPAYYA